MDWIYGAIKVLDENIGALMDALDELKLTDNTMVIFFSDNGGTNGGNATLWEGGIRVPVGRVPRIAPS